MENINQSTFQEFEKRQQENEVILNRGELFQKLQRSNDLSEYSKITGILDGIEKQIADFTQRVDEQVLVSSEDKADTFDGAKRVDENVFDAEIQKLIQQLNTIAEEFSQNNTTDIKEFSTTISSLLDGDDFVAKLPEDTSLGMRMMALRGGYKERPGEEPASNPIESHGRASSPIQTAADHLSGKTTREKMEQYF